MSLFPSISLLRSSLLAGLVLTATALPMMSAELPETVATFLDKHCYECHDDVSEKGKLNLLDASFDPADTRNFELWAKVFDRIDQGEMPPKEEPRPEANETAAVALALADTLIAADQERKDTEGRMRLRRLNRVEYEYTLRDLLNLPELEIKEMLPPDPEAHGFDNNGEALRISYVQMAAYLEGAQAALKEAAWLAPEVHPYEFRLPFSEIRRYQITSDLTTIGKEAVLLRQPNTAQTPWYLDAIQIPFPGTHTIRLHGRAVQYQQEEGVEEGKGRLLPPTAPQIVSVYQGSRILGSIDLTKTSETHEITAWLHPDQQLVLYVPTMRDWNPTWKKGSYTGPGVALEWIELSGPGDQPWPLASYRTLFDELPTALWSAESGTQAPAEMGEPKHPKRFPKLEFPNRRNRYEVTSTAPEADAKRLLQRFMKRAFRQPVPETEVDRYLALVLPELAKKKPFHEALMTGYTAILSSPDFLYFAEQPGQLDDHALASRLSYFLWRSMPDETLRSLADEGKLNKAAAINDEVERMLKNPKAKRFIEDFTGQWLNLRDIRATQPDEKLYPEFDDFLLESMVAETRAFFEKMVRENLPVRTLVDSDFVFANRVLADLYDLKGVDGVAIQEVSLPPESKRGGLLTQAAVLKVTANGTTTSPVVRGAWVLDRLLGTPAPPPPPKVPAIEPDTRGATTIRQLLEKHRADAACAGCHAKIDPPGFAMESFDVIGGWRDRYRSLEVGDKVDDRVDGIPVSYRSGLPVDTTGTFGEHPFSDIDEFRTILLKDERQLARNLAERLIVFATGAGISFTDRIVVERILDETEAGGYGLRDLINAIVQSDLFRHK
ncbi:MAG: DUF1592 domain-containing protein [Verrucomicrobiae bacterium]|nr:DUF1592 domain-containing protein [Verrucomicrobiae bacterium]